MGRTARGARMDGSPVEELVTNRWKNEDENYAKDSGKRREGFRCSLGHLVNHKQLDFISRLKNLVL